MCPDKELFSAYVDGEVPEPWCSRLTAHIATCEKCRNVVDTYNALKNKVKAGETEPSKELFDSSFRKITEKMAFVLPQNASIRHGQYRFPLKAIAAVFAVAFIIPAAFFAGRQSVAPVTSATGTEQVVSTANSVAPMTINFPGFNTGTQNKNFRLNTATRRGSIDLGNDFFTPGYSPNLFSVSSSSEFNRGQIVISFPGLSVYTSNPEALMPYGTIDIMFYPEKTE